MPAGRGTLMKSASFTAEHSRPPDVIGVGLIAFGMAVSSHRPEARHIGTGEACAKILSIRSWLGWQACPATGRDGISHPRASARTFRGGEHA